MTHGDYRDGTRLSFTPPARTTTAPARLLGVLLLAAGLTLAGVAIHAHTESEPLRTTGAETIGVLIGYEPTGEAQVQFQVGATTVVTQSRVEVALDRQREWGTVYRVHYDAADPGNTFIDGLDPVDHRWDLYGSSAVLALVGTTAVVFPPRTRARQR